MTTVPVPEVTGERLAVITGHSLPRDAYAGEAERLEVAVEGHGPVTLLDTGTVLVLPRHGLDEFTPAHLVDHHAHIAALCTAGAGRVVALASVGSLRRDWPVGTMVAPDDFIAPQVNPTFFADARGHAVPGFDPGWRQHVVDTWTATTDTPLVDGATYVHSIGPRFETPAEVRMLATFADLVGMTLAAECILAGEVGLPYAAICGVDNLANGLDDELLTEAAFRAGVASHQDQLRADLAAVLPRLAAAPPPTAHH